MSIKIPIASLILLFLIDNIKVSVYSTIHTDLYLKISALYAATSQRTLRLAGRDDHTQAPFLLKLSDLISQRLRNLLPYSKNLKRQ